MSLQLSHQGGVVTVVSSGWCRYSCLIRVVCRYSGLIRVALRYSVLFRVVLCYSGLFRVVCRYSSLIRVVFHWDGLIRLAFRYSCLITLVCRYSLVFRVGLSYSGLVRVIFVTMVYSGWCFVTVLSLWWLFNGVVFHQGFRGTSDHKLLSPHSETVSLLQKSFQGRQLLKIEHLYEGGWDFLFFYF